MKKIFIFILAFVLAIPTLFGTVLDTATLTLNTKVQGVYEIGIFDSAVESNQTFPASSRIVSKTINEITPTDTGTKATEALYLAVRTNQKLATKITFSLEDLETTAGDKMKYNFVFTDDNITLTPEDNHTVNVPSNTGLKVYNFPFRIEITELQYRNAVEGDYTTTITFEYETT